MVMDRHSRWGISPSVPVPDHHTELGRNHLNLMGVGCGQVGEWGEGCDQVVKGRKKWEKGD